MKINSGCDKGSAVPHRVVIELDAVDAAVVGATLRMLAAVQRSPDPDVAARLRRVGDALTRQTREAQVIGLVRCFDTHAAIKADAARWATLPYVGVQELGGGRALELRNCPACKSTLSVEIAADEIERAS